MMLTLRIETVSFYEEIDSEHASVFSPDVHTQ